LEYAINRRLKDKKSKATGYSKQKAAEANLQFDFIDPLWIPKSSAGSLCSDNQIKNVVNMVKRHSIMHPLIPVRKNTFWNTTQIYEHCVREMYEYCYSNNLSKLWGYLWVNWYNRKDWKLFARSAYLSAMPLARTTMITESHWRVLKYNYKYNYNRPRLDRLTQILVEQLVPDFNLKLIQYNTNRSFPSWWQTFKKDWEKNAVANIEPGMDERYHIDEINWICSCPAFLNSSYLICKHLVSKKDGNSFFPTFMETARRHDYPLIIFGANKVSAIHQENDPWKRYESSVIVDAKESASSSKNMQNVVLEIENNTVDEVEEKLTYYKKIFDSALMLYKREKDNDKFVKNFDALLKPAVEAIEECTDKLNAQTQQRTWGLKNSKLSLWLR
jgi:hypothetical protein